MTSLICEIEKTKQTKQNLDSLIQRTDWCLPEERRVGGWAKWVRRIKKYRLSVIK